MTTKWKIVSGFTLVLAVLIVVAIVGYRGLNGATRNFNEYDRLARINVAMSDMTAQVLGQAYELKKYLRFRDSQYANNASDYMRKATGYGRQVHSLLMEDTFKEVIEKAIAESESYILLIDNIDKNMSAWQKAYDETVREDMNVLRDSVAAIGQVAADDQDLTAFGKINALWHEIAELESGMSRFVERGSKENAQAVEDTITKLGNLLGELRPFADTVEKKRVAAETSRIFERVAGAFAEHEPKILSALEDVDKTYVLDTSINNAIFGLKSTMEAEIAQFREEAIAHNTIDQQITVTTSIVGILLGILLAAFIIVGFVRVLNDVSSFAAAVANGNFA